MRSAKPGNHLNLIFALFLFLLISHYLKKSVHGPGPWQGVHGPGPWKWSMDLVQSRGPWTPRPCFVLTHFNLIFLKKLSLSCTLGKLRMKFTSAVAKSTSPGLLDTTFFLQYDTCTVTCLWIAYIYIRT